MRTSDIKRAMFSNLLTDELEQQCPSIPPEGVEVILVFPTSEPLCRETRHNLFIGSTATILRLAKSPLLEGCRFATKQIMPDTEGFADEAEHLLELAGL